jgi:hypothetical protein
MANDRSPHQPDLRRAAHQAATGQTLDGHRADRARPSRLAGKLHLLRQYEKFFRFLRNELLSNNLTDFGLRKGLDHLDAVRQKFQTITDRFADFQAQALNVHVDFPLLQNSEEMSATI